MKKYTADKFTCIASVIQVKPSTSRTRTIESTGEEHFPNDNKNCNVCEAIVIINIGESNVATIK